MRIQPVEEQLGTIGCIVNEHVDGGGVLQLLAGIGEVETIAQFGNSVYLYRRHRRT
jgi:hypothetical protein